MGQNVVYHTAWLNGDFWSGRGSFHCQLFSGIQGSVSFGRFLSGTVYLSDSSFVCPLVSQPGCAENDGCCSDDGRGGCAAYGCGFGDKKEE